MALVEGEEREDQSLQIPAGTLPSDVFEEATREIKKPEQELEQEQEKKKKKRGNQDPGPPPPPPEGHSAPYISTKGGARVWFCESQDKKHQKVYEGGRWKEVEPEDKFGAENRSKTFLQKVREGFYWFKKGKQCAPTNGMQ